MSESTQEPTGEPTRESPSASLRVHRDGFERESANLLVLLRDHVKFLRYMRRMEVAFVLIGWAGVWFCVIAARWNYGLHGAGAWFTLDIVLAAINARTTYRAWREREKSERVIAAELANIAEVEAFRLATLARMDAEMDHRDREGQEPTP